MGVKVKIIDPRIGTVFPKPAIGASKPMRLDLVACIDHPIVIHPGAKAVQVPTGIALQIDDPNVSGMLLPLPDEAHVQGMVMGDIVRIVGNHESKPLSVSIWNRDKDAPIILQPGARIAQMVFVPLLDPEIQFV